MLGGEADKSLLNIRIFDERTKKSVYAAQTDAAEKKGEANCPLCALGTDANKTKIWKLSEMDADHVTAWSKGGATDIKNCQMLCKAHNRAKENRKFCTGAEIHASSDEKSLSALRRVQRMRRTSQRLAPCAIRIAKLALYKTPVLAQIQFSQTAVCR